MEAEEIERVGRFCFVSKLILSAIFGALTGCIAMAGAITGAIAGALASRASESGFLRGASLGAIAGAIISVEVFEASRAYWCLEQNGSRSSSSMADFIEQLVRGRLVEEQFTPAILTAYSWQVGGANTGDGEIPEVHSLISPRGLSGDSLKKLPHHVILKDTKMENLCCTICLQDIEVGEVARSLPRCHHTFHLNCVDRWLVKNDSCPVCRQYV
ncbi:NEP1-interacting protein-like 2 isoform X1 [Prosopis cineraria]|uniref:NEP1-interacting protein-like 2 isoform X1 n=1 Tax=Prosopis cineraria TaxID=364024 RepID=UPI0024107C7A|nr:NEP1-interacting protein-like 2 isoform X1 [Prosopis cineraria]XP_054804499.1 NEP1-interacting protein-like 2 isoform X1 [Prosopis cineraria]